MRFLGHPKWVSQKKMLSLRNIFNGIFTMYVRKKKNPSGVISIQVIDKSHGKYKVLRTIGSSSDVHEVESLYQEGKSG